uniref:Uncharacterized protein n=1 Tax=Oryza rufipogon TaxID=4529 RepID=A0A0E0MTC1_ORYRU
MNSHLVPICLSLGVPCRRVCRARALPSLASVAAKGDSAEATPPTNVRAWIASVPSRHGGREATTPRAAVRDGWPASARPVAWVLRCARTYACGLARRVAGHIATTTTH